MITIETITPYVWETYSGEISALEQTYPEQLRAGEEEIAEMISAEGSLSLAAFVDGVLAGAVFGYPLDRETAEAYRLTDICSSGGDDIYLESITVDDRFRGRGIGAGLIDEFMLRAKQSGFKRAVGHYRKNGSLSLAKKAGSREVRTEHDWFGTGEDFVCCVTDLQTGS